MHLRLLTLLLTLLSPLAAEAGERLASLPEAPRVSWQVDRMRLGLQAERWSGIEAEAKPRKRADTCAKWRSMARQLGETFAGHTLRRTVVENVCGLHEAERPDESWEWPWSGLAQGGLLPPRAHRAIGAWEIRCGTVGVRRRCALIHQAPVPPDAILDPGDPALVTHFVIDMVGGREVLLWRLFVPTVVQKSAEVARGSDIWVDETLVVKPVATPDHRQAEVRYALDRTVHIEKFPTCGPRGCLMEANAMRAGSVATRLASDRPVDLSIRIGNGDSHSIQLPTNGFRAALSELVRLRQEEQRAWHRRK